MCELPRQRTQVTATLAPPDLVRPVLLEAARGLSLSEPADTRAEMAQEEVDGLLGVDGCGGGCRRRGDGYSSRRW